MSPHAQAALDVATRDAELLAACIAAAKPEADES